METMDLPQSALKQLPYELSPTLYLTIFGLISVLLVLKLTRRNKSINLPPSPPKLPIIGNLHQLGTLPHRSFHALSKKYGPLMFLQLGQTPTLVVSSADVAKEIAKNHDVAFSSRPKSTAAKYLLYDCQNIGCSPYGEEWRQKKKLSVLELLSAKRVKSFQPIREEEAAELVGKIREACASKGACVNLSEMLLTTTNNIVCRCALGQKYGTPSGNTSFGEIGRKVVTMLTAFSVRDYFPSLGWIDYLTGLIPKLKATFGPLDVFFDEVVAEHKIMKRKDDQSKTKDFVDIMLQIQESSTGDFDLTPDKLKAILLDMFSGGSDTVATAMEWVFAELLKNPNSMRKAQEEIRRVVGSKLKVEENDVNLMNYLKCVVKETLRLHPPLPLSVPRETISNVNVGEYDIPPKTKVHLNTWAIQRDDKVWDNSEEFIPERFERSQVDMKGQDFQLIPFGMGRRGCPGISFTLASVEYVLANLLYWFDWKVPGDGDIDMSEIYGIVMRKKVPLHLEPVPFKP